MTMTNGNGKLTLNVKEVAALLGISENLTRAAIDSGEIPSMKIGRRILIPRIALEQMIARESGLGDIVPSVVSSRPQH